MLSILDKSDTLVILEDVVGTKISLNVVQKSSEKSAYVFLVSSQNTREHTQSNTPKITYGEFVTLCTELSPIQTWY